MKTLVIDTTFETLIVGVMDGKSELFKVINLDKLNHQKKLLSTVDEILREKSMTIEDIECIAVVVGPGSFTGIRIGIATALGLSFASNIKRVELNGFEVIGYQYSGKVGIEAGKGNMYVTNVANGNVGRIYFNEAGVVEEKSINRKDIDYVKNLALLVNDKIKDKIFSKTYTPLYVRESQAERMHDRNK